MDCNSATTHFLLIFEVNTRKKYISCLIPCLIRKRLFEIKKSTFSKGFSC